MSASSGYSLGIDLGTTFTSAALSRSGRAEIVNLADRSAAISSVVFFSEDGSLVTGTAAERRAMTQPDRVAREFKRRFGDTTPLFLGGSPYSAESLMAKLLADVYARVTMYQDAPPDRVAVTYPASWGPYKRELFEHTIELAALPGAFLVTEPEAAAVHYSTQERFEVGSMVAVYDLGGGTFDAVVLRKTSDGFEVVGEPVGLERLGGIDFDAAVLHHVDRSLDGVLGQLDPDDPLSVSTMARVRNECIDAKEALSTETEVSIPVVLPNLATEVRLTRREFEDLITPSLRETIAALERAIGSAAVDATEVSRVLLVGGSSRIPLVADLVWSTVGLPVAVDAHPKHAIALGAATVADGTGRSATTASAGTSAAPDTDVAAPAARAESEEPAGPSGGRSKYIVGALAAVAAVAAVGVVAVVVRSGGGDDEAAADDAAAEEIPSDTEVVAMTAPPPATDIDSSDELADAGNQGAPSGVVDLSPLATLSASSERGGPVERAVDGDPNLDTGWWGAGHPAPAWLEFDFGQPVSIARIELLPSQTPATLVTRHEVLGRASSDDSWEELFVAEGETTDNQFFEVVAGDWPETRYLRINTTDTASNVSWGEVEIYGTPSTDVAARVPGDGVVVSTGAAVSASSAAPGDAPADVLDGIVDRSNRWAADGAAPQAIELDLGEPTTFDEIDLLSWEDPEGLVRYVIEVAGADQQYVELADREVLLRTGDRLRHRPPAGDDGFTDIRFVRVTTLESDNPPTWAEIELLAFG